MGMYEEVENKLRELEIDFEIVEHEPALTTEQADRFIEGMEGVRTKTMFLTDKKKSKYYLLIMDDRKKLDMKLFGEIAAAKGIRMASADSLQQKMGLTAGMVSPFGLLNNQDRDIQVYFDKEIVTQTRMSFHPNTNEKTIFLNTVDLFRFLEALGYQAQIISL